MNDGSFEDWLLSQEGREVLVTMSAGNLLVALKRAYMAGHPQGKKTRTHERKAELASEFSAKVPA
jgi:hypothetical protein